MAISNLHETLLSYTLRRNEINLEISNLQSQKTLATYSQADAMSLKSAQERSVKAYYKGLWEQGRTVETISSNGHTNQVERHYVNDVDYKDYTDIPGFEDEIDKIVAEYTDKLAELTAWETEIDAQITTDSAELEEVNAYMESLKSMLQTNIQDDFNYGLNG